MIDESTVGFIGRGAMGVPMAMHLAEKLPSGTKIYAFDVVQSAVDQLVRQFPDKVFAGKNARDVAEKSGIIFSLVPLHLLGEEQQLLIFNFNAV